MERAIIHCFCGLARALPRGIKLGDKVNLVPCPECGSVMRGELVEQNGIMGLMSPFAVPYKPALTLKGKES